MKSLCKLSQLICLSLLCTTGYNQDIAGSQDTSFYQPDVVKLPYENGIDLFASDEPLQLTLYLDIREFLKTRGSQEYSNARLTIKLNETDSVAEDIKIKPRGIMRLTYCSFPPIMLKFKGNDSSDERAIKKGTVKLVTHCNRSPVFENYILKEYLTYKLFNLVTPYSFKTRLVRISYIDTLKAKNSFTAYGFLIENEDEMAKRNKAVLIKNPKLTQNNMYVEDMARVAVFNFLIGNTDWSVTFQHNVKILVPSELIPDKAIPVAYDFDYSGLVNTSYSLPREGIPIQYVTERYYLGLCFKEEELMPVINEFWDLKEQFLDAIRNFEYLSMGARLKAESYIENFYKVYRQPDDLIDDLNCTCQK